MSKTASIAANAGMSFETTSALLAQMIETTQEAPENIGTAMKTIIARFTELKKNVSATESEFEDLDYNKVDTALKTVGINIKDATGQFRNLDDVFLELSSKWDTLDRNSQRYIATIAAGSRQQSRFIAMMENYERTMQLVNIA
jgi:TP901 family phage tail tape measure protein